MRMKKLFTTMVVALALVALPAQAQVKFGIMGGLNITNMTFNSSVVENAMSNQAGFFVGPTVKFTLPIVGLGVDASALYDQRSAKESESGETFKSQSIQVPINVRYGIGLGSLVNVFVFAGPQFGFAIGDKTKTLKAAQEDVAQWTLKSSNLSANIGLGATLFSHLQAKVNYNIALGKTGEMDYSKAVQQVGQQATNALGITEAKANSWQISVAYIF